MKKKKVIKFVYNVSRSFQVSESTLDTYIHCRMKTKEVKRKGKEKKRKGASYTYTYKPTAIPPLKII